MKFVITAGGQGTKVWPYSRQANPKQFQKIIGDDSLFTNNINVLLERYSPQDIFISTKRKYLKLALDQAPRIPLQNYIIEPDVSKDRGPAEGLVFLIMSMKFPDEPMMLIQSDNIRIPEEKFLDTIDAMEEVVTRDKKFITGGLVPDYPALGVDYFNLGKKIDLDSELEFYAVEEFLGRKSNYDETKELVENNDVVIHCNHACWYPELFLAEYKKHAKDWYEALMEIKDAIGKRDEDKKLEEIYSNMRKGSTEEVTKHVFNDAYIVKLPFNWVDLGTWDSLYNYMADDTESTYSEGNVVTIDSEKSFVISKNRDKLVALMGVNNYVVVDTEDILLIIPREKADQIKNIHEKIKEQNLHNFL